MIGRGGIITGHGIAVPDKVVTNDDLSLTLDTNDEWIRERTGIRERRIGGTTSQLAIDAGLAALEKAGRRPDEIDAVILATTTPDQIVPGTSATVQDGIGIVGGAFDVNAACSGFVYALTVGHGHAGHRAPSGSWSSGPRRCRGSPTGTSARCRSWWATVPAPWCSKRSTGPASCSATSWGRTGRCGTC